MRTANPALNQKVFSGVALADPSQVMTLEGTVNKAAFSILLTVAAAYWSWTNPQFGPLVLPLTIVGFVIALVLWFKRNWAPVLTPAYAVAEGLALGAFSLMAEMHYPGIAFQAISLTFGVFLALLMAYKSGLIKPSENFKLGVAAATGGIMLMYVITFVLRLFGMEVSFLHGSSPLSILISIGIVIVAALNLVLDFDFIENASARGTAPKYMEWFGAFGLLVTLVWLYVEILRLLMKLNDRR